MKQPVLFKYRNGVAFREHNKATSIIEHGDSYMIQIKRAIKPSELHDKFIDSHFQFTATRAGIIVLYSRMLMSKQGLLSLGITIQKMFEEHVESTWAWEPNSEPDDKGSVASKATE